MPRYLCLILSSVFINLFMNAQDVISQEYFTLSPQSSFTFQSIANKSKIWGYSSSINIIYDKMWNELERHDAGQSKIFRGQKQRDRSAHYDSSEKKWIASEWQEKTWDNYADKYNYSFNVFDNYFDFFTGNVNSLQLVRAVNDSFLERHSRYCYNDTYDNIAGLPYALSNSYTSLITHFEIVDWDGNITTTIEPPYYIGIGGSCQCIDVEDKSYVIVSAYAIYPKDVEKDCNMDSSVEYDLSSKRVEPDYYHYFIYEYNKTTNTVKYIKSETSEPNRAIVGIYDIKGNRLKAIQPGINILLYSDGTSEKIMQR